MADPVWISRDAGPITPDLSAFVTVWKRKPSPMPTAFGIWWCHSNADAILDVVELVICREVYGTVPDNDKQLIRVGGGIRSWG